jgi:uncharacterized membrane protein
MKQSTKRLLVALVVVGLLALAQMAIAAKCDYTYDTFGKAFMEKHCTKCHDSKKTSALSRMGAPKDDNFDTVEGIQKEAQEIVEQVVEKMKMPPGFGKPTETDREKLKSWIQCEYPPK